MTAVRRAVKSMEKGVEGEPEILIQRQDIDDAMEEVRREQG